MPQTIPVEVRDHPGRLDVIVASTIQSVNLWQVLKP
jgi:hypothetical protein